MESIKEQLKFLITQGEKFAFKNSSDGVAYDATWGEDLSGNPTPAWISWRSRTSALLGQILADRTPPLEVLSIGVGTAIENRPKSNFEHSKKHILAALRQTLEIVEEDQFGELRQPASKSRSKATSNRVFVVHGHDNELKVEVENFIKELHLEPVVLHRQPDQGRTVIEKFEANTDVGYAFILLTPDEIAYASNQESKADDSREKERRARPNVIFEFGYFVGALGRDKVCCLHKGDVTLPSDLSGVIYKKVDSGLESQKFSILRELKAAGYEINL